MDAPLNNSDQLALQTIDLTVHYEKTPVLWEVNLAIPQGKLVAIIGPNGAGKSTLIKTAMGLVPPASGKVLFLGESLQQQRQRIAYVPQRESVDWDFPITVRDLVLMGRYPRLGLFHWPRQADRMAADDYLAKVGMSAYADRQINQLSGGQQQRAFLARALMQEADIYFLDEPFSGIDMATERVIMQLMQKMQEHGKTLFVVHHDLSTVQNYFDWVIILNMRLVAAGPVEEVFHAGTLDSAYGKSPLLFDTVLKLSRQKNSGIAL